MLRTTVVLRYRRLNGSAPGLGFPFGRFFFPLFALLLITGCAPRRAHAQFIGYTSPQTSQQNLATNVTCTGGPQNFVVNNIAQFFHVAQLTAISAFTSQINMVIQGSNDGVTFTNISDNFTSGTAFGAGGGVSGNGYFPVVRVQVTCTLAGGSTFSLSYSGVAGGSNPPIGTFLQKTIEKDIYNGPANTNSPLPVLRSTPYGSSAGQFFVLSGGGVPAGSTVNFQCQDISGNASFLNLSFSLSAAAALVQTFSVPAATCPAYTAQFISGGASASSVTVEFLFAPPGLPPLAVDPCASSGYIKSSVVINITTATTTQLVAPVANQNVYACGITVTIDEPGTTVSTLQFEAGTGATCGTGTVLKTGQLGAGAVVANATDVVLSFADPGSTFSSGLGNGICAVTTGTTAVNVQGVFTFVQQ